MKLEEFKQKIKELNLRILDCANDCLQLCINIGSNLCDSLLGIVVFVKDDKIYMTDDYFLIESWTGDEEIENFEPLDKIKNFAQKYNISFDFKLEKVVDLAGDIKRQVIDFFKVELFADLILSENVNKKGHK